MIGATVDRERAAQLRQMKRRASGLLLAVTAAFVGIAALGPDGSWGGYALAAAEGSMVGGLADWFAVTALFRHPFGLPIPHTAIIRERKDQFGETLGAFVQENFLSPDIVAERIRAGRVAERVAAWLSDPTNARSVARSIVEALVGIVDLVGDDDVHRLLQDEINRAVHAIPFAQLAGRALRVGIDQQRHVAVVDAVLKGSATFLDEQRGRLQAHFGQASPWWLPGAIEHRLFDRVIDGARTFTATVAADPDHEVRATIEARLRALADQLEHDPGAATKVGELVDAVVSHPDVRGWTRSLWTDLNRSLHAQLGSDESRLVRQVAEAVAAVGQRLSEDAVLQERVATAAESAAGYVIEHHQGEISSLISATIARWDADETSTKLELLLGRDLQFIRINGTVVGGVAGLAIHGVAGALG